MGKHIDTNPRKIKENPPDDKQFIPHWSTLLTSPAWQAQSIQCRKLIEFLEIEHLRHAGLENDNLKATYNQLKAFGIGKQYISLVIDEAEALGLLIANRGMRKSVNDSYPNTFRLTYLKYKSYNENENISKPSPYYVEPTHDWQRIKKEKAQEIKKHFTKLRRERNKKK